MLQLCIFRITVAAAVSAKARVAVAPPARPLMCRGIGAAARWPLWGWVDTACVCGGQRQVPTWEVETFTAVFLTN